MTSGTQKPKPKPTRRTFVAMVASAAAALVIRRKAKPAKKPTTLWIGHT